MRYANPLSGAAGNQGDPKDNRGPPAVGGLVLLGVILLTILGWDRMPELTGLAQELIEFLAEMGGGPIGAIVLASFVVFIVGVLVAIRIFPGPRRGLLLVLVIVLVAFSVVVVLLDRVDSRQARARSDPGGAPASTEVVGAGGGSAAPAGEASVSVSQAPAREPDSTGVGETGE